MKQEVSISKAINRGHLIINLPVFLSLIGFPILGFYLSSKDIIPQWGIAVLSTIGFIIAWILWSYLITKWRIWAFENVRNVHELKRKAIEQKLIWNDGNIFEKTEIRSKSDKRKLKQLEQKFQQEDVYLEDRTISSLTKISFSKKKAKLELFISILLLSGGFYLISSSTKKGLIFGIASIIFGIYEAYVAFKKLNNSTDQISIDKNGIKLLESRFISWTDITNENVVIEGFGKHKKHFLIFDHENGFEKIKIDDLNVTSKQLEKLLKTYRIRHEKSR